MSDKERRLPRSRTAKIALPTVAALGAGGAFAAAAIPGADGTITGCYTSAGGAQGNLRVIDEGETCGKNETQIKWNQKGQPGDRGPAGPQGPQGQQGPAGANGTEALLIGGQALNSGRAEGFLKLDGVEGESTDSKHAGEIDIESFSFGVTNSGSTQVGGGGGAGRASFSSFKFNKLYDASSPALFEGTATGEHFKSATFAFRRAGGESQPEFLTIKLSDVLISGYQQGGTKEPPLLEAVSLDASKIEINYRPQRADGSLGTAIRSSYDLKTNTKG